MRRALAFVGLDTQDVKYAVRTFLLVFLPIFATAALGWLNEWTQWSPGRAFPDYQPVAAAVVSGVAAGVAAVFTLIVRGIEGKSGKALLRPDPPKK